MTVCTACVRPANELHHVAGRALSPVTTPLCVPCHGVVSRWQTERWNGQKPQDATSELLYGTCDVLRLIGLRSGVPWVTRLVENLTRSIRRIESTSPPRPCASNPKPIEAIPASGDAECWARLEQVVSLISTTCAGLWSPDDGGAIDVAGTLAVIGDDSRAAFRMLRSIMTMSYALEIGSHDDFLLDRIITDIESITVQTRNGGHHV